MTMKHFLWLLAAVLMASCATTRKTSESRENRVVKDSTVLTIDTNGNVVKSEHYRNTERNREQNRDTASENLHSERQKGSTMEASRDTLNHWTEKSEKAQIGVPWYVWLTGGVLVSGVWGIVWFYTFGWRKV